MIESPWEMIGSLKISAQGIAVVDPTSWDPVKFELVPGLYDVWIRTIQDGTRVSRVRVMRGRGGITAGVIGQVGTDVATLMLLDANAMSSELGSFEDQLREGWQSDELTGTAKWGPDDDAVAVFVRTGFGDGTYEVKEVLGEDERIGMEVEFIDSEGPFS